MLVRLIFNAPGIGKAGEEVEVTQEVGNHLNSRGEAAILRHTDERKETSGTDKRANPRGG